MTFNITAIIVPVLYEFPTSAAYPAPLPPIVRVPKRLWDFVHLETPIVHLLKMLFHLVRSTIFIRPAMMDFVLAVPRARCRARVQKTGVSDLVYMEYILVPDAVRIPCKCACATM